MSGPKIRPSDWQSCKTLPILKLNPDSTWKSQCDFNNLFGSPGRATGGVVSDAGSETINVAAGTGFIKATDDDTADLLSFDWGAETGIAIATDTVKYVGIEYNDGTPQVVVKDSQYSFDLDTDFMLAKVVNEAGVLHILNAPWWVTDGMTNLIERVGAFGHVVRDTKFGGLILSVPGTRNIAVSAGKLWSLLNEFDIAALDTSDTGTVELYYVDSGGTWRDSDVTQYSVLQWNDTTQANPNQLVNLSNNWYANIWVYAEADDTEIALLYPQAQYANVAVAEAEAPPTNVPTHISENGILIGRILIKQNTDTPIEVQTAFDTIFNSAQATDHGNLAGLGDDDHTQYILHSLATAADDFLVASGSGVYVKKTLAETGAILEGDIDHGNLQGLSTGADHSYIDQSVVSGATPTFTGTNFTGIDISAGTNLAGGSGITLNDDTLDLDINSLSVATIVSGDFVPFWDITATATNKKTTFANFEAALTHDSLIAGTIADHDTTATGTNLTELTDGSDTTLHDHDGISEAVAHISADGSSHSFIDQDVQQAASPQFAGATLTDDLLVQRSGENTEIKIYETTAGRNVDLHLKRGAADWYLRLGSGSDLSIIYESTTILYFDSVNPNLTINATQVSANYDLMLAGDGVLGLKETTTPTADASYGKVYTKNDDKLYFQDGAGAEHEIAFAP